MLEIEYTPEVTKKDECKIEGSMVIRVPLLTERLKYIESCGFQVNEAGELDISHSKMGPVIKLVEISQKHIVSVNMKSKDGLNQYSSYEELCADPDCDNILYEVGSKCLSGFKPSKN